MTPRKPAPARPAKTRAPSTRRVAKRVAKSPPPPARRGKGVTPAEVEAQLTAIERGAGKGDLDLGGGVALQVSSLDKIYFPEADVTKGALMRYYTRVSPYLLPEIDGRPLVLKRYPDGVGGQMFFQQDAGAHVPDVVRVKPLPTEDKGVRARIIGGDLATLLYTVQLGAIEVHPWLSRVSEIDAADRCLIDLDPGDDVPFSAVVELARDVRRIADQMGLRVAVKTSGASGIHLVFALPPRTSYDVSARLAMLMAKAVVALRPERATVERSIKARPAGSIYVDAMQNARGKSMASVYSVRARPAATVSAPLQERELVARLRTSTFNVRTMPARIARIGDVWAGALGKGPTARILDRAMEALEKTLAAG